MPSHSHSVSLPRPITALAVLAVLTGTALAQIPENSVVISRFQGNGGATSGLAIVDLAAPGTVVEITGLPPELTGSSSGLGIEGGASVLINGRTGQVIVGEHALPGASSDIHVLTLAGNAVVLDDVYPIGNAPGGGGWIDQMAWMNDDIIFTSRGNNVTTGPMAGHHIGIFRPYVGPPGTPGTILPVPITTNPAGATNALAVDEKNGIAYFAKFQNNALSEIWSLPVVPGGPAVTPTLVATLNTGILNMAYANGELIVGSVGGFSLNHVDVTVNPATVSVIAGLFNDVNAVTIDNASGDFLLADSNAGQVYRLDAGLGITVLGSVTGGASGVAVRQTMATYGQASIVNNDHEWALAPNPGGEPTVGNVLFSMTVESSPGTALGVYGVSLAESTPLPVLGATLLIDPTTVALTTLPPAASSTVPLPIPNNAALGGFQVFGQVFHLEGPTSWSSTRGIRVTITQ